MEGGSVKPFFLITGAFIVLSGGIIPGTIFLIVGLML